MEDHLTKVTQMSQTLERLLEKSCNARGRGLLEKLSSVQNQIPNDIQKQVRFIATIQKKATRENAKIVEEKYKDVQAAYNQALTYLSGGFSFWDILKRKLIVAAIAGLTVAVLYLIKIR
ncbi:MAG: hypothetical protein PHO46_11210 [Thermoguttaceae bacterium]|nr:hypothetical protein [Thermoguttaceae bacterium]